MKLHYIKALFYKTLEYLETHGTPCIEYRENLKCSGDVITSFTIDPNLKPVTESYKRCANRCLSETDVVAFNWLDDTTFTCECLSSGKAYKD